MLWDFMNFIQNNLGTILLIVGGIFLFLIILYFILENITKPDEDIYQAIARRKKEREKRKEDEKLKKEGESFDWDYDKSSQTLTISGQGHMPKDWHPWGTLRVSRIVLKDGIISIASKAFRNGNLNASIVDIDFGNTLQIIESEAFYRQSLPKYVVFPASLLALENGVFANSDNKVTYRFKSQNPPSLDGDPFRCTECKFEIPKGCLKNYLTLSCWQNVANRIEEKDVSLMLSNLEMETIEAENKRKNAEEKARLEEEQRKKRLEEERKKKEAEEKARLEEERRKKEAEEKARLEEERRKKEAEEKARLEEERRKKEAEEKARLEEERRKKETEEKARLEEERRKKEAEEKYRAEYEAKRRAELEAKLKNEN